MSQRKLRVLFILWLGLTVTIPLIAQDTILFPGLTGQELRDSLVANYKPNTVLPYDQARDTLFAKIDNHNDSLRCVYTGYTIWLDPTKDPTVDAYNKDINTEHTWPQSKGATGNAKSDMHHLYPVRVQVNEARSNNPFDEIVDTETDEWYRLDYMQTTIPTEFIDEYSENDLDYAEFEPREDHKGNAARSMFYFYTMYQDKADSADANFFVIQKDVLYQWHYLDEVDDAEVQRTYKIADYQEGKVNPFIIDTTLVRRAYFSEPEPDITKVIISELMIDPNAVYDSRGEWIEIFNPNYQEVDINGWRLRDDDTDSIILDNGGPLIIPARDFIVLGNNSDYATNGHVEVDYQYSNYYLGNNGDEVIIEQPDGNGGWWEVDRVAYDPNRGWPVSTGASMVFTGNENDDNNDAANWVAASEPWPNSAGDYGSPGYAGADQSLPVSISSFGAKYIDGTVILNWVTESELNNAGFEIYRAVGGDTPFRLLADYRTHPELAGRGNSNVPTHYRFVDKLVVPGNTYWYKLASVEVTGERHFFQILKITAEANQTASVNLPTQFRIFPNYPNPFNPSTTFHFSLPVASEVEVRVSDVQGQEIAVYYLGKLSAGEHYFLWDTERVNRKLASGVYVYTIVAGSLRQTGKMILLK